MEIGVVIIKRGKLRAARMADEMRHSNSTNFLPEDFDELLDALSFPKQLSEADKEAIHSLNILLKEYPPRTVVRSQGEYHNRTFLIRSGWACSYILLPDGGRQITNFYLRGDVILGVESLRKRSNESLQAISNLSVFELPTRALYATLESNPALSACFLANFVRHRAILAEHLANLGRRRAVVRTTHLLLEIGTRLQKVGLASVDGYECPLTQNDLADALGLTPIHMSRTLRELREAGWINLHNGRLTFLDREAAVNFAQFDPAYLIDDQA
jgi:CRP-like cAMP-binding protein